MSRRDADQHNRPGTRTNTPQHLAGTYGGPQQMRHEQREGRPTGKGTSAVSDVADPHPSDEGHPYRAKHPGGRPDSNDTGPNDAKLDFKDGNISGHKPRP